MKQFFINLFLKIMASKAIYIPLLTGAVVAASGGVVAGVVHYQHTHEVVSAETDTEETTTRDFKLKETTTTAEVTTEAETEPVELIPIEELTIIEDNSSEPVHDVPVEEASGISSSDLYEVDQLVYGIDVSRWQGDINWSAVAADGITFAMIKCGGNEGGLYEDSKFKQNIEGALANGIQVGVYFYSGATNAQTALQEASLCLELIKDYQITYPVAIDWEMPYGAGSYSGVTDAISTFCNAVASHGYQAMAYSNKYRWYDCFDGGAISSRYKTWMACYFNEYQNNRTRWKYGDDVPDFNYGYDMWQYSSNGYVNGISGRVDMNIAFFGYANYKAPGLQEPKITIANTNNVRYYGSHSGASNQTWSSLDGVSAVNSLGYKADVEYHIYCSNGNEAWDSYAITHPDNYTIYYSFKDPKSGKITAKSNLSVIYVYETFNASDIYATLNADGTLPSSTDLTANVSCINNVGDSAPLADYSIIQVNKYDGSTSMINQIDVYSTRLDPINYNYIIRYTFDVPKDTYVSYDVNLFAS
ncbi:MAG: hypothetical protein E7189_01820 [Erysipelotrichaceae bacterium]|nr:hypothetical protein [Erysipelotrichaceae bacterium]